MAVKLTAYFSDGSSKSFSCSDDEEATMMRDDLLAGGHEERSDTSHIFYPAYAITKIVLEQD